MNSLLIVNKVYRKVWLSQLVSLFGDAFYDVALVWYLMEKTGSALIAGGIVSFNLSLYVRRLSSRFSEYLLADL